MVSAGLPAVTRNELGVCVQTKESSMLLTTRPPHLIFPEKPGAFREY